MSRLVMETYDVVYENYFKARDYSECEICDKCDILEIRLKNENGGLLFVVDDYFSYRKTDEGSSIATLERIAKTSSLGGVIYKVKNSRYKEWLLEESDGILDVENINHYCITTIDFVIDIICSKKPEFSTF